jgi:cytochrome c oxidase subunit 1
LFASFVLFLWNAITSAKHGVVAGDNPWTAGTLEWATSSPPQPYNFARIPFVTHREPLWHNTESLPVVTGLAVDIRQLITGSVAEALPEHRESSPAASIWPLVAAIATGAAFVGSIFNPWAVVYGAIPVAIALILWFWPTGDPEDEK